MQHQQLILLSISLNEFSVCYFGYGNILRKCEIHLCKILCENLDNEACEKSWGDSITHQSLFVFYGCIGQSLNFMRQLGIVREVLIDT